MSRLGNELFNNVTPCDSWMYNGAHGPPTFSHFRSLQGFFYRSHSPFIYNQNKPSILLIVAPFINRTTLCYAELPFHDTS
jgi:hypothetical protein